MKNQKMRGIIRRGESYSFTVYMGRRGDGRQIRKYMTWRPPYGVSRAKADRLAAEQYEIFRARCRGHAELRENMRFSELCELYFEQYAPAKLKPVTTYNYRSAVQNHLLPEFGALRLRELTTPRLSRYFVTECKLAAPSCNKLRTVLSGILSFACTQGYLAENPCRNALCRKKENAPAAFLQQEQAAQLCAILRRTYSQENVVLYTLLHTGLRVGECLALRWQDVDLTRRVLRVQHTLCVTERGCFISEPKTRASARAVNLPEAAAEYLEFHREKTAASGGEFVFAAQNGGFLRRESVRRSLYRTLDAAGLPRCPVHALRHTFASLLINSGIHIKAVSSILGHSSVSVTGDVYAHVFADYQAASETAVALRLD